MEALHQLPARREPPRKFPEGLVLLEPLWIVRISARLTVLVMQVLVTGKEPQAIANHRTAKRRRGVVIPAALVPAVQDTSEIDRKSLGLTGQAAGLPVVRN